MKPTLPDGLPEKVLECIKLYPNPNVRVTKANIAAYCGLADEYSDNNNNPVNRAIKDTVSGFIKNEDDIKPICAESGKAGYFYAQNREDAEKTIKDLNSRGWKIINRARNLERYFDEKEAAERALERKEVGQMELAL